MKSRSELLKEQWKVAKVHLKAVCSVLLGLVNRSVVEIVSTGYVAGIGYLAGWFASLLIGDPLPLSLAAIGGVVAFTKSVWKGAA